jgi:hypothetical protein
MKTVPMDMVTSKKMYIAIVYCGSEIIGDRIFYRAFDGMFKLDAQSITDVRVVANFLEKL